MTNKGRPSLVSTAADQSADRPQIHPRTLEAPQGERQLNQTLDDRPVQIDLVTQAHGLDSGQHALNYVAGWASQASTPERGIEAVVAETGARVIAAADKILAHTKPADLEVKSIRRRR